MGKPYKGMGNPIREWGNPISEEGIGKPYKGGGDGETPYPTPLPPIVAWGRFGISLGCGIPKAALRPHRGAQVHLWGLWGIQGAQPHIQPIDGVGVQPHIQPH